MSDIIPPKEGEIWAHVSTGKRVRIGSQPSWYENAKPFPEPMVWYKALYSQNGTHTALTKMPLQRFLKQFRPEMPQPVDLGNPSSVAASELRPAPWPQPINTSTLSLLASVIRARSSTLYSIDGHRETEKARRALDEIADALDEIADDAALVIDRSTFLSMDVSALLVRAKLADRERAIRALAAGDVYLDGQRVTEDAPITTVTRERFTVRCGERSAVVRVVG
jgi:hypothetical protein